MLAQRFNPIPFFVFPQLEKIPYFIHAVFGRQALISLRENKVTPEFCQQFLDKQGAQQAELLLIHQIHSDRVLVPSPSASGELGEADGIILGPGQFSLVRTADCIPLLVIDPAHRHLLIIHAGWRGTRLRILERAIKTCLQQSGGVTQPNELIVTFGPAIRKCCYEVGPEVRDEFLEAGFPVQQVFRQSKLDLIAANTFLAKELGVVNFLDSRICTACSTDLFFSYRKQGTEDRNVTLAGFRSTEKL